MMEGSSVRLQKLFVVLFHCGSKSSDHVTAFLIIHVRSSKGSLFPQVSVVLVCIQGHLVHAGFDVSTINGMVLKSAPRSKCLSKARSSSLAIRSRS
jgi:hypothetical protein